MWEATVVVWERVVTTDFNVQIFLGTNALIAISRVVPGFLTFGAQTFPGCCFFFLQMHCKPFLEDVTGLFLDIISGYLEQRYKVCLQCVLVISQTCDATSWNYLRDNRFESQLLLSLLGAILIPKLFLLLYSSRGTVADEILGSTFTSCWRCF